MSEPYRSVTVGNGQLLKCRLLANRQPTPTAHCLSLLFRRPCPCHRLHPVLLLLPNSSDSEANANWTAQTTGGNALLTGSPGAWVASLADYASWRPIKFGRLRKTNEVLPREYADAINSCQQSRIFQELFQDPASRERSEALAGQYAGTCMLVRSGSEYLAAAAGAQDGDPVLFRGAVSAGPFRGTVRWNASMAPGGVRLQATCTEKDLWMTAEEDGGVTLRPPLIEEQGLRQTWRIVLSNGQKRLQNMGTYKNLTHKRTSKTVAVVLKCPSVDVARPIYSTAYKATTTRSTTGTGFDIDTEPHYDRSSVKIPCAEVLWNGSLCWSIQTPNTGVYPAKGKRFTPTRRLAVIFAVQATNDAHIGLFTSAHDENNMYAIVIGGWGNTQSTIRRPIGQSRVFVKGARVSGTSMTQMWLSLNEGKLSVGNGSVVGQNTWMWWTDPAPLTISEVVPMTGWGATGQWTLCLEPPRPQSSGE